MDAEAVVLHHVTPVEVDRARALLLWADAVAPVVGVGVAAARPAQIGDIDRPQGLHHVVADAARVGDGRLLAHPDPIVNAATQVFGKVPVDVAADGLVAQVGVDHQAVHVALLRRSCGAKR